MYILSYNIPYKDLDENTRISKFRTLGVEYEMAQLKEDLKAYRQEMAQKVLDDDRSINQ